MKNKEKIEVIEVRESLKKINLNSAVQGLIEFESNVDEEIAKKAGDLIEDFLQRSLQFKPDIIDLERDLLYIDIIDAVLSQRMSSINYFNSSEIERRIYRCLYKGISGF